MHLYANAPRDVNALPQAMEITRSFKKSKPRKAFGEDSLPPELFASFPRELMTVFFPAILKSALLIGEKNTVASSSTFSQLIPTAGFAGVGPDPGKT